MANVRKYLARRTTVLTTAVGTLDFTTQMGWAAIRNLGPASLQFVFDGTATGVDADNQTKLAPGEAIGLLNVSFRKISIYCMPDGASCEVDAAAQPAPAGQN